MARKRITEKAVRKAIDDLIIALGTRHRLLIAGYWEWDDDAIGVTSKKAAEYRLAVRWRQAAEDALAGTERGRTRTAMECVAMGLKNLGDPAFQEIRAEWGVL